MSDSLRPHGLYTVCGILQARILEWVAVPSSRGSSQPRDRTQVSHITGRFFTSWATREAQSLSCIQLSCSLMGVACQAPLGFPGKNTAAGSHFLLQIFPTEGLNPSLLHWQASSLPLSTREFHHIKSNIQIKKSEGEDSLFKCQNLLESGSSKYAHQWAEYEVPSETLIYRDLICDRSGILN